MKNSNLLLIAVLLWLGAVSNSLFAQTEEHPWSIGLYGVKTEYLGDLRNYSDPHTTSNVFNHNKNTIFDFDMFYGGGAISLDRYLSRFFDLGIYGSWSTIGYDYFDPGTLTRRNFDAKTGNVNLHTRFKFLGQKDAIFVPYITLGAGSMVTYDVSRKINPNANQGLFYVGENRDAALIKQKKVGDETKYSFLAVGGVGLEVKFSKVVSLRYQADIGWTDCDVNDMYKRGKETDWQLQHSLGLAFTFGKGKRDQDKDGVYDEFDRCPNTPLGIVVDQFGCPLDADSDGVPDYLDKCPDTPKGAGVDASGCPLDSDGDGVFDYLDKCPNTPKDVTVDAFGCPLDSDGDGVPDYLDKCPDTPRGANVDASGCPLDSDGDGVFDYLDKCPNTPKGVKVDEFGCPLFILPEFTENILFDTGKYTLKQTSHETLDKIFEILSEMPNVKVKVQGHTDNVGNARSNLKLSQNRAAAVMSYLEKKGISQDRMIAQGFGDENPIADNATDEGRQKNRRVEFHLETIE